MQSANCSQIVYGGEALSPFTRYDWTVEWTSSSGDKSAKAKSRFEVGPIAVADWQGAGWLKADAGGKTQLRNTFSLPASKAVTFARAYVAAAGCAHIEINGKVPLPDLRGICPWPVNSRSVRYMTHDITSLLASGAKNAIGLILGNTMMGAGSKKAGLDGPQSLVLVVVQLAGEAKPVMLSSSDKGWMQGPSHVVSDSAWATTIDWTKEQQGWSTGAFVPDASWTAIAATPATGTGDAVSARALAMPLSTVLDLVKPSSVTPLPDGAFLYTFPKNFVGTIQFAPLPAAATGSNLTVLLGEWLKAKDSPAPPPRPGASRTFPHISGGKQQYENHKLRAGNAAPLTTLFCWHGFQYVRVTPSGATGFTGQLDALVGLAIHTNMTATGSLTFGGEGDQAAEDAAEVLTHINAMTLQSQRTNVAACKCSRSLCVFFRSLKAVSSFRHAHRLPDAGKARMVSRLYRKPIDLMLNSFFNRMGDALDASEQALYNFDMGPVHDAFIQTVEDNQGQNGDVPVVVPGSAGNACNDIAWTSAFPQITAMQHEYYGDTRTLKRKFQSLARYQEHLIGIATTGPQGTHAGLAVCDQFKDWLCGNAQSCCTLPGSTSCPVGAEMGGFNYVLGLRSMATIAAVLGNSTAAARYHHHAELATKEFHSYFYNKSVGRYGDDDGATQSLSLPALKIGSPPDVATLDQVVKTVGDDLTAINYTLAVGAVTSKILFNMYVCPDPC